MSRYTIRTGHPSGDVIPDSPAWGYCKTLHAARRRSAKLSRCIRSDCQVGIECEGVIIERSETSPVFVGQTRPTTPVTA